jgi:Bestrophin, RFP-TM, chloride channel
MSNTTTNKMRSSVAKVAKKPMEEVQREVQKAARALPFVPQGESHQNTWAELDRIEKLRRRILTWSEEPFWRILAHWNGTCLRDMVRSSLFWITIALYVSVRMQSRYGDVPTYVINLDDGSVGVLGGFLSFFLVLYVNQSLRRYFAFYDLSMACKGRVFDVATLAKSYLSRGTAFRLIRWMNAAHCAGYVGLSSDYPFDTFFAQMNTEMNLLTEKELDQRIKPIDMDKGGAVNREIISWCLREISNQQRKGVLDNELAQEFRDQILRFRSAMGLIYDAADLPIPFFYVHFICLLSVIYLPLFALSAGYKAGTGADVYWTADVIAGLVVMVQSFFVNGLRIIGQKMSDPYGTDMIDLSVIYYVRFTWTQSYRVLNTDLDFPDTDADEQEEHLLSLKSVSIGAAWEPVDEEQSSPKTTTDI